MKDPSSSSRNQTCNTCSGSLPGLPTTGSPGKSLESRFSSSNTWSCFVSWPVCQFFEARDHGLFSMWDRSRSMLTFVEWISEWMNGQTNKHNYSTAEDRSKHREQEGKSILGGLVETHRKATHCHGEGVGERSHTAVQCENTPLSYTPLIFCFSEESAMCVLISPVLWCGWCTWGQCVWWCIGAPMWQPPCCGSSWPGTHPSLGKGQFMPALLLK